MSVKTRSALEPRRLLTARREERELLAAAMSAVASPAGDLRILEAGCGQRWPIQMPDLHLHITGIDLDAEALRIRKEKQGDLETAIVGDLVTVDIPESAYDVAYCAFVLEHVAGAKDVIDRLIASVRPGGRVVILVPDGQSVYGFFAKRAPFRAAVFYKRYIEKFKDAGKPGHAPYPTVYDSVVTLAGMREYASAANVAVIEEYGIDYVLNNFKRTKPLVRAGLRAFAAASRGRLTASHNNLGFVFERSAD